MTYSTGLEDRFTAPPQPSYLILCSSLQSSMSDLHENQNLCHEDMKAAESDKDHHARKEARDCKLRTGTKEVPGEKATHIDCEKEALKNQQITYYHYQEDITTKDAHVPKTTEELTKQKEEFQKQLQSPKEEIRSSHQENRSETNEEQHNKREILNNQADSSKQEEETSKQKHMETTKSQQEESHKNQQLEQKEHHTLCHQKEPIEINHQGLPMQNQANSKDSQDRPPKFKEIESSKQFEEQVDKDKFLTSYEGEMSRKQQDNYSKYQSTDSALNHQGNDPNCKAEPWKTHLSNNESYMASHKTPKDSNNNTTPEDNHPRQEKGVKK